MADSTPTRLGEINGAGDAKALFLKVFSGLVMNAFDKKTLMFQGGRHIVRNISSGKTAQFPFTGRSNAVYHTPGAELLGLDAYTQAEKTIAIDDVLVSHEFVAEIDEAMAHYDTRMDLAKKMGEAMALAGDARILQSLVLNARATAPVTGEPGGTTITSATMESDVTVLADSCFTAAQNLDENDVNSDNRYLGLRPAQYYQLLKHDKTLSSDYSAGNGDYARAQIYRIADLEILKSNRIPSASVAAVSGDNNTYNGDFSVTTGVIWTPNAVGTVKLVDLTSTVVPEPRRLGSLLISKMAMGHGGLDPACAVELRTGVPI